MFKVKDILGAGINLANKIGDFFNCGSPETGGNSGSNQYKLDGTLKKPKSADEQQGIMDGATAAANNASQKIEDFSKGLSSGAEKNSRIKLLNKFFRFTS